MARTAGRPGGLDRRETATMVGFGNDPVATTTVEPAMK
jgi:hypothetical protein